MATPQDAVFGIQFSVYIGGVYMPASSVSVTTAFNAVPQCTIALPAYSDLYGIGRHDRMPVHVFFLDNITEEEPVYKLFFEGVIIGFGYFNNSLGRSFVIQCEGIFNILHKIFIRFLTTLNDLATATMPGQGESQFTKFVLPQMFPMMLFSKDGGALSADSLIDYPTQLLENAINFIANYAEENKLASFYKKYFERNKMTERFSKLAVFDELWDGKRFPTLGFLTDKAAIDAVIGQVHAWGQKSSMYDLICGIMDKMEYEFAFFNSPMLKDGKVLSTCLKPILYDALPPKCNVIFRSIGGTMSCNENISDIPTRVMANDVHSIANSIFSTENNTLQMLMTLDCYPTDGFGPNKLPGLDKDAYASEILEEEEFTGPKIDEVHAPEWWSYINSGRYAGESEEEAKKRFYNARTNVLKNLLQKKRYEGSRLTVHTAFNPYVTAGFPGVVFDNADNSFDSGFCFIGQILSVVHELGKSGATTTIEFGFVRTINEEDHYRLKNTYEDISTKATDVKEQMDKVYQSILGCDSVTSIKELHGMIEDTDGTWYDQQNNPLEAYKYNKRSIITQEEFMETFMGFNNTGDTVSDEYRNYVPTGYDGHELLTERNTMTDTGYHPDYIERLKAIQSTEIDQRVYDDYDNQK